MRRYTNYGLEHWGSDLMVSYVFFLYGVKDVRFRRKESRSGDKVIPLYPSFHKYFRGLLEIIILRKMGMVGPDTI